MVCEKRHLYNRVNSDSIVEWDRVRVERHTCPAYRSVGQIRYTNDNKSWLRHEEVVPLDQLLIIELWSFPESLCDLRSRGKS